MNRLKIAAIAALLLVPAITDAGPLRNLACRVSCNMQARREARQERRAARRGFEHHHISEVQHYSASPCTCDPCACQAGECGDAGCPTARPRRAILRRNCPGGVCPVPQSNASETPPGFVAFNVSDPTATKLTAEQKLCALGTTQRKLVRQAVRQAITRADLKEFGPVQRALIRAWLWNTDHIDQVGDAFLAQLDESTVDKVLADDGTPIKDAIAELLKALIPVLVELLKALIPLITNS